MPSAKMTKVQSLNKMDHAVAISAMLLPTGLVLGNIGFELSIGLAGLLWIVRQFLDRGDLVNQFSRQALFLPMVAWVLSVWLSRAANGFTAYQLMHDMAFLRYLLYVLAISDVSMRLPMSRYLLIGLVGGVLMALLNTVSAHVFGFDLLGKPLARYTTKLKEAARIAALCAYTAPFFLIWLIFDRALTRQRQILLVILSVVLVVLMWKMRVRTAFLGLGVGVLGGVLVYVKHRMRWIVLGGVAGAIGMAVTILNSSADFQWNLDSFFIRTHIWKVCWEMWQANPVFGVGISSFQEAYHEMAISGAVVPYIEDSGTVHKLEYVSHAHNLVIQLMSSTGLIGVAAFAWVVYAAFRHWRLNATAWHVGLCTVPFVLIGISVTGWNIFDPFYTSLVVFFLGWMGTRPGRAELLSSA